MVNIPQIPTTEVKAPGRLSPKSDSCNTCPFCIFGLLLAVTAEDGFSERCAAVVSAHQSDLTIRIDEHDVQNDSARVAGTNDLRFDAIHCRGGRDCQRDLCPAVGGNAVESGVIAHIREIQTATGHRHCVNAIHER